MNDVNMLDDLHLSTPNGKYVPVFIGGSKRFYLYFFDSAYSAGDALFPFAFPKFGAPLNKVLSSVNKCYPIGVDLMFVSDYEDKLTSFREAIRQQINSPGNIAKILDNFETTVPCVTTSENTTNTIFKEQVASIANRLGLEVTTNKSRIINDLKEVPHCTRVYSSQPDLAIYSLKHCVGAIVQDSITSDDANDTDISSGGTVEAKNSIDNYNDVLCQLIGNMEKLSGDLAYYHLNNGKLFTQIVIYGLMINYNKRECTAHRLTMDFSAKVSTFLTGEEPISLQEGASRLLASVLNI